MQMSGQLSVSTNVINGLGSRGQPTLVVLQIEDLVKGITTWSCKIQEDEKCHKQYQTSMKYVTTKV